MVTLNLRSNFGSIRKKVAMLKEQLDVLADPNSGNSARAQAILTARLECINIGKYVQVDDAPGEHGAQQRHGNGTAEFTAMEAG